jgi:hypothetical protein
MVASMSCLITDGGIVDAVSFIVLMVRNFIFLLLWL